MKKIKNTFLIAIFAVIFFAACQQPGGNTTGSEFVPDMAHSVAYEANVTSDYSLNSFEDESVISRRELAQPRLPVEGTIPHGYAGISPIGRNFSSPEDAVKYTLKAMEKYGDKAVTSNGYVPYYYENSDSARIQASNQIIYNPFPITANGLERGEELYNVMCGICHGEKGDGNGYLVSEDNLNAAYPAQPKNLLLPEYVSASNGQYYHAIMHGINVMGGYADKLSYEERWQVIHYIRALQAKEGKLAYDENLNTLNPTFGVPGESLANWILALNDSEDNDGDSHSENHDEGSEGDHSHDGNEDGDHGHEGH